MAVHHAWREHVGPMGEGPRTVLVVEDDDLLRELIAELLRAEDYVVLEAPDAETAVDLLAHRDPADWPSCGLVDLGLPGLSGLMLLKRLAADGPDLGLVALSGSAATLVEAIAAGADATLLKPFDIDRLL